MSGHLHVCSTAAFLRALDTALHDESRSACWSQASVIEALSARPGRVVATREMVQRIYASAHGGTEFAETLVRIAVMKLRRRGYPIEKVGYRGYRIGGGA